MVITQEMLATFNDDSDLLKRVITDDKLCPIILIEASRRSPKITHKVRSNVKVLLTVFFDCNGMVPHEFLPQGHTVNKNYYLEVMR